MEATEWTFPFTPRYGQCLKQIKPELSLHSYKGNVGLPG